MAKDVEDIYQQQLKPLSTEDRLRSIAMLAQDLAASTRAQRPGTPRIGQRNLGGD